MAFIPPIPVAQIAREALSFSHIGLSFDLPPVFHGVARRFRFLVGFEALRLRMEPEPGGRSERKTSR